MSTVVRFLQFLTLGTWVGSILYFGAIVAPAAFTVLTQDQAGALVGLTLGRLHLLGIVAGVIYLLVTAIWARSAMALVRPAPLLVIVMLVLTFVSQFWVMSTMDALRAQMGSVAAAPPTRRAARFVRPAASHLGEPGDGRARRRAAGALLHQPRSQGRPLKRPFVNGGTNIRSPLTLGR